MSLRGEIYKSEIVVYTDEQEAETKAWLTEHFGEKVSWYSLHPNLHKGRKNKRLSVYFKNPRYQALFELTWSERIVRSKILW